MDMTFLEENVETCEDIDSFQSSRFKVHGINVVNDPSKRAVKLTTEFLSSVKTEPPLVLRLEGGRSGEIRRLYLMLFECQTSVLYVRLVEIQVVREHGARSPESPLYCLPSRWGGRGAGVFVSLGSLDRLVWVTLLLWGKQPWSIDRYPCGRV